MSIKYKIYSAIKTKLNTDVTSVKTVRLWNGQPDSDENERVYEYPAVFIEFQAIDWKTDNSAGNFEVTGNMTQQQTAENATITLHCCFWDLRDETDSFSATDDIVTLIYIAMQQLCKESNTDGYFTGLNRIAERMDVNHNNVLDWQMDFVCCMHEQPYTIEDLELIEAEAVAPDVTIVLDIDDDTIRTGGGEV